jgi:hypothetical protein
MHDKIIINLQNLGCTSCLTFSIRKILLKEFLKILNMQVYCCYNALPARVLAQQFMITHGWCLDEESLPFIQILGLPNIIVLFFLFFFSSCHRERCKDPQLKILLSKKGYFLFFKKTLHIFSIERTLVCFQLPKQNRQKDSYPLMSYGSIHQLTN